MRIQWVGCVAKHRTWNRGGRRSVSATDEKILAGNGYVQGGVHVCEGCTCLGKVRLSHAEREVVGVVLVEIEDLVEGIEVDDPVLVDLGGARARCEHGHGKDTFRRGAPHHLHHRRRHWRPRARP